jgi:hypothetical protein
MIKFYQKNYNAAAYKKSLIEHMKTPAGLIATSALGISTVNMASNLARHHTDLKYQGRQLKAMEDLTKSLDTVDRSLKTTSAKKSAEELEKKELFDSILSSIGGNKSNSAGNKKVNGGQRNFSVDYIGNSFNGGLLGGTIGAAVAKFSPAKKLGPGAIGIGTLIGAALGLVYSIVKDVSNDRNRENTVDNRLMKSIVSLLKANGLKEGKDFTRDPKIATDLRTKVSIVVNRDSGDLKLIVNSVSDYKLKKTMDDIIRKSKSHSNNPIRVSENLSDRYNDISIITVEDPSNAKLVAGIVEGLVKEGYPVYILEVG